MNQLELKYGCNPNQKPAKVYMKNGEQLPIKIVSGNPGYINLLDAFNSWQLVKELHNALGYPSAASFKHVSPTSAALGLPMSQELKKACFVDDIEGLDDSPLACAYARARGTDRMSSFGDFIALSDICDATTARLIKREVSDGVIAPGYSEEAMEILKNKKKGKYNVIEIDSNYVPETLEEKQVFGVTFQQRRNDSIINESVLDEIVTTKREISTEAKRDLVVALITLKYTQSNSVCFAQDGQAIGVGAGQQSRIHCTRLAGVKADNWHLRQSQRTLDLPFKEEIKRPERDNAIDVYLSEDYDELLADGQWEKLFSVKPAPFTKTEKREYLNGIKGVALASDAFFPFSDNIERAAKSGVSYIAQPGGSIRDQLVIDSCNELGIAMAFTHVRLFHH